MSFELPHFWIVALNIVFIPAIHLAVSWGFTRLPGRLFSPRRFPFCERPFEQGGAVYERLFRVRAWKRHLPDAAPWFKGFAKKNLRASDPAFLEMFRAETCRGEAAHYAQIPALMITLLWTPWPAAIVIVVYAFLSNLPCIFVQRHTRHRLTRVLAAQAEPNSP